MSNSCIDCGAKDAPDWDDGGRCIKCARDKALGPHTDDELTQLLERLLDQAEPYMKHGVDEDWPAFIADVQRISILLKERETAAIAAYIKPHLDYCQEVNGRSSCKNCGLKQLNERSEDESTS